MVSGLIDNYPDFAVIQYRVSGDPHETDWGNDRGTDFYNIWSDGIPWFAYDGLFDAWPINTYESKLQQRQATSTDVLMSLSGAEAGAPETYEFTATLCLEFDGAPRTVRVYMVDVLDHYPGTPTYLRNTFRQAAATEDVQLEAGLCVDVVRSFTFGTESMAAPEDIRVIAWAQEPMESIPAKIHQAAISPWPLESGGDYLMMTGCETGDLSDWDSMFP